MTWLNADTGKTYDSLDDAPPGAYIDQHEEKEKDR